MGLPVTKVGWSKWEKEKRLGNRAYGSGSEMLRACGIHRSRGNQGLYYACFRVKLIGATRTNTGLEVHCWLDEDQYDKGRKVTNAEMHELFIKRDAFHGEWNYELHPRRQHPMR